MTIEITGDTWTFVRRTDAWITVIRNGVEYGVLSPHGTRGRDYRWMFQRSTASPGELAGATLADAKRWLKTTRGEFA